MWNTVFHKIVNRQVEGLPSGAFEPVGEYEVIRTHETREAAEKDAGEMNRQHALNLRSGEFFAAQEAPTA